MEINLSKKKTIIFFCNLQKKLKNYVYFKMNNCEGCEEKICECPICMTCGETEMCSCKFCKDCGDVIDGFPCSCFICDLCGQVNCEHN